VPETAFAVAAAVLAVASVLAASLVWLDRRRKLREYVETDTAAAEGALAEPTPEALRFEAWVDDALASLPPHLRERMANVEVVVEDEPPPGLPLLGLYHGVPLTARGSGYGAVAPDKISIYRGPLERLYGADPERLEAEVHHVVLHEVAHHFGISDARLVELDRY
jgi:predicted Zn-dependent protease with MMP-like domain